MPKALTSLKKGGGRQRNDGPGKRVEDVGGKGGKREKGLKVAEYSNLHTAFPLARVLPLSLSLSLSSHHSLTSIPPPLSFLFLFPL